MGTLCFLFFTKSFVYFQYSDLFINKKNEFNYSNHIKKIGTYDNVDFINPQFGNVQNLKKFV